MTGGVMCGGSQWRQVEEEADGGAASAAAVASRQPWHQSLPAGERRGEKRNFFLSPHRIAGC
eukprot:747274-Hanusia_phi.AAC.2